MSEPASRATMIRWALLSAFVLLLGIGTFALAVGHQRQISMIVAIEKLGASVRTERLRPEWMSDPLLDQWARGSKDIVRVRFSKSGATRAEIERLLDLLEELPHLGSLRLKFVPLTDADFERLSRFGQLEAIDLDGARVRDENLSALARLPRLDWLVLDNTGVSDAGVAHLRGAARLEMVSLENTLVSDAALEHLTLLPALKRIYLAGTRVMDAGVEEFRRQRPAVRINR